jgi:hypothetical protein
MASLDLLQQKWVEKFAEMKKRLPDQLVTPWLTVEPDGYGSEQIPLVLYVGKASGPNQAEQKNLNAEQLRQVRREFLKSVVSNEFRGFAFCDFALQLSDALKHHTGHDGIAPLQNLVWSNICKIGVCGKKPPNATIYGFQRDLAVQTLQAEIEFFKPKLVYWATHKYHLDAIRETVGDEIDDDITWANDPSDDRIYTRGPKDGLPAMIRGPHPERKSNKELASWIELACSLIGA